MEQDFIFYFLYLHSYGEILLTQFCVYSQLHTVQLHGAGFPCKFSFTVFQIFTEFNLNFSSCLISFQHSHIWFSLSWLHIIPRARFYCSPSYPEKFSRIVSKQEQNFILRIHTHCLFRCSIAQSILFLFSQNLGI